MWASIVGALVSWVLGLIGRKSTPTITDEAEAKGAALEQARQAETASEVQSKAAAARSAADLRVVQSIAAPGVDPAANDQLAELFPDQFRD